MTDLVIIEHNQAFTTSLAIAEGTGNTHQSVLKLVEKHKRRFNKFQRVGFEIRPFNTSGGQQVRRVAILDERQAYLLMTMLRNTERVLDFKEALVDAFIKARDLLMTGQMGLMQTHAILTLALDNERDNASHHGRGLADWKRKRDELQTAINTVKRKMQPELPLF